MPLCICGMLYTDMCSYIYLVITLLKQVSHIYLELCMYYAHNDVKVCGSDGVTYSSYAALLVADCEANYNIRLDYYGACSGM